MSPDPTAALRPRANTTTSPLPTPRLAARVAAFVGCCALAATAAAVDRGWEYQPYRIQARLAIGDIGGDSRQRENELAKYLERRAYAALGPLWKLDVQIAAGAERHRILSDVSATIHEPPAELPGDGDKLLLLAVRSTSEGYLLTAREFDRYVQHWGTPIQVDCRQDEALAEQLFAVGWQAVAPLAQFELDPNDDKLVRLTPRGAALVRHSAAAAASTPGDVFLPVLRRTTRTGEVVPNGIQVVPWTYLEVTDRGDDRLAARIHSGNRRPFGVRRQGRVEQVAIALRAQPGETVLQLRARTDNEKPLVGYEVFSQAAEDDAVIPLGTTDRRGQIAIPPGETRIRTLYLKNGGQLLARLPVVPGAQPRIEIPLPDDDPRLAVEARLAALREELIDVVARRNILMARARQKIEQGEFDAAQKLLADADQLPGRSQFNLSLSTTARTLRSDDPQIQRRIDQLVEATQTVMNQYLDLRPINELHDQLRAAQRKGT